MLWGISPTEPKSTVPICKTEARQKNVTEGREQKMFLLCCFVFLASSNQIVQLYNNNWITHTHQLHLKLFSGFFSLSGKIPQPLPSHDLNALSMPFPCPTYVAPAFPSVTATRPFLTLSSTLLALATWVLDVLFPHLFFKPLSDSLSPALPSALILPSLPSGSLREAPWPSQPG